VLCTLCRDTEHAKALVMQGCGCGGRLRRRLKRVLQASSGATALGAHASASARINALALLRSLAIGSGTPATLAPTCWHAP